MRFVDEWSITAIADEYVLVPIMSSERSFKGIVRLNESGKEIWEYLKNGSDKVEIIKELIKKYNISSEQANYAVCNVITKLINEGIIIE